MGALVETQHVSEGSSLSIFASPHGVIRWTNPTGVPADAVVQLTVRGSAVTSAGIVALTSRTGGGVGLAPVLLADVARRSVGELYGPDPAGWYRVDVYLAGLLEENDQSTSSLAGFSLQDVSGRGFEADVLAIVVDTDQSDASGLASQSLEGTSDGADSTTAKGSAPSAEAPSAAADVTASSSLVPVYGETSRTTNSSVFTDEYRFVAAFRTNVTVSRLAEIVNGTGGVDGLGSSAPLGHASWSLPPVIDVTLPSSALLPWPFASFAPASEADLAKLRHALVRDAFYFERDLAMDASGGYDGLVSEASAKDVEDEYADYSSDEASPTTLVASPLSAKTSPSPFEAYVTNADGSLAYITQSVASSSPQSEAVAAATSGSTSEQTVASFFLDEASAPRRPFSLERSVEAALGQLQQSSAETVRQVRLASGGDNTSLSFALPAAPRNLDRLDQRHLPLDGAYDPAGDGSGVRIYAVGSGVRSTHEVFGDRIGESYAGYFNGNAWDLSGSGTAAASVALGRALGVASGATLHAVKVADSFDRTTLSAVVDGLGWIAQHNDQGGSAVALVTPSGAVSPSLDRAVKLLTSTNVVVVVPAGDGNGSDACATSPAHAESAIVVASSTSRDALSASSNLGRCVSLVAPAEGVPAAGLSADDALTQVYGTVYAAAEAAGAAAVLLGKQSGISALQAASRLEQAAVPIAAFGEQTAGGLLSAQLGYLY